VRLHQRFREEASIPCAQYAPVVKSASIVCSSAPAFEWSGGQPVLSQPPRVVLWFPLSDVQNVSLEGAPPAAHTSSEEMPMSQELRAQQEPDRRGKVATERKTWCRGNACVTWRARAHLP
jgi:hypothetical protein